MGRTTATSRPSKNRPTTSTSPTSGTKYWKWTPGSPQSAFSFSTSNIREMNLDVVKTRVAGVYIGFCTRAWAPDEASYLFPMEKGLNNTDGGDLAKIWKHVFAFLPRRDMEINDGVTPMKTKKGSKWDWKAVLLLIDEEDTSIEKACRHVANCFTKFTRNKDVMDNPEKYTFNQYFGNDPQALSHYLLDLDVAKVLNTLVCHEGSHYATKEDVLEDEDILQSFFGSAEAGREYLEGMEEEDWELLVDGSV